MKISAKVLGEYAQVKDIAALVPGGRGGGGRGGGESKQNEAGGPLPTSELDSALLSLEEKTRARAVGGDMPLMPLETAEAGEDGQGGQGGGDGMDEAASQELPEIDTDIEVNRGESVGGGLR